MKQVIIFLVLTFSLFFGTGFLIIAVNGQEGSIEGDIVYHAISDGLTFLAVMLCIIFSIVFMFLYNILEQLKKLNNNK